MSAINGARGFGSNSAETESATAASKNILDLTKQKAQLKSGSNSPSGLNRNIDNKQLNKELQSSVQLMAESGKMPEFIIKTLMLTVNAAHQSEGKPVIDLNEAQGRVRKLLSGSAGKTFDKQIAMASLRAEGKAAGSRLIVDTRKSAKQNADKPSLKECLTIWAHGKSNQPDLGVIPADAKYNGHVRAEARRRTKAISKTSRQHTQFYARTFSDKLGLSVTSAAPKSHQPANFTPVYEKLDQKIEKTLSEARDIHSKLVHLELSGSLNRFFHGTKLKRRALDKKEAKATVYNGYIGQLSKKNEGYHEAIESGSSYEDMSPRGIVKSLSIERPDHKLNSTKIYSRERFSTKARHYDLSAYKLIKKSLKPSGSLTSDAIVMKGGNLKNLTAESRSAPNFRTPPPLAATIKTNPQAEHSVSLKQTENRGDRLLSLRPLRANAIRLTRQLAQIDQTGWQRERSPFSPVQEADEESSFSGTNRDASLHGNQASGLHERMSVEIFNSDDSEGSIHFDPDLNRAMISNRPSDASMDTRSFIRMPERDQFQSRFQPIIPNLEHPDFGYPESEVASIVSASEGDSGYKSGDVNIKAPLSEASESEKVSLAPVNIKRINEWVARKMEATQETSDGVEPRQTI